MNVLHLTNLAAWPALIAGLVFWAIGMGLHYRRAVRASELGASTESQRKRLKLIVIGGELLGTAIILVAIGAGMGLFRLQMPTTRPDLAWAWLLLLFVMNVALYAKYRRDARFPRAFWLLPFGFLGLVTFLFLSVSYSLPWQAMASAAIAYMVLREFSYRRMARQRKKTHPGESLAVPKEQ